MRVLLCVCLLGLAGPAFGQDIVGRWRVDKAALARDPSLRGLPPAQRKLALRHAEALLEGFELVVDPDGTARAKRRAGDIGAGLWTRRPDGGYTLDILGAERVDVRGNRLILSTEAGRRYHLRREVSDRPLPEALRGVWRVDAAASRAAVSEAQVAEIDDMLRIVDGMVMDFGPRRLRMTVGDSVEIGAFNVERATDETATIKLWKPSGSTESETVQLRRLGVHLSVSIDGKGLLFKR